MKIVEFPRTQEHLARRRRFSDTQPRVDQYPRKEIGRSYFRSPVIPFKVQTDSLRRREALISTFMCP